MSVHHYRRVNVDQHWSVSTDEFDIIMYPTGPIVIKTNKDRGYRDEDMIRVEIDYVPTLIRSLQELLEIDRTA